MMKILTTTFWNFMRGTSPDCFLSRQKEALMEATLYIYHLTETRTTIPAALKTLLSP